MLGFVRGSWRYGDVPASVGHFAAPAQFTDPVSAQRVAHKLCAQRVQSIADLRRISLMRLFGGDVLTLTRDLPATSAQPLRTDR